jgi:hypothetical protein
MTPQICTLDQKPQEMAKYVSCDSTDLENLHHYSKKDTTSVHKYMTPLTFFENFNHSSYSKYLFKNVKF